MSMSPRYLLLMSAMTALLSGCGGGDGNGPVTAPTPSNAAPVVSVSSTSPSAAENSADPLTTVSATDADGDTVSLTLEGADAALFTLNNGELSFAAAPDFEAPGDVGADNIYDLTVVASDGNGGTDSEAVTVTVTDLVPLPSFTEVATGFSFPTYAAELEGTDGRLLVLEKGGRTRLLDPDTGVIETQDFLAFDDISSAGEGGVLGFAVAPDYANSRTIYFHVNGTDGATEIRRYQLAAGTQLQADPATRELVIRIPQPLDNHNAGSIGFDANGFLVVPMGDGGGANDPNGFSQNPQSLLGKVLRLDVTGDDFPADTQRNYAIPAGNTFDDPADGLPEIFAVGLRNPFRSSFDPATGDLIIADVGQDEREEVNRLPMDDSSLNFGWNIREGSIEFMGNGNPAGLTLPIAEYEHGDGPTQGNSITGGVVFDGESDVLDNAYVFADFSSANIWAIPADTQVAATPLFGDGFRRVNDELLLGSERPSGVVSFAVDSQNRLFVTTINGQIYRLDEVE